MTQTDAPRLFTIPAPEATTFDAQAASASVRDSMAEVLGAYQAELDSLADEEEALAAPVRARMADLGLLADPERSAALA